MTKTVKEHFENCKQVSQVVDDANALLSKVQRELAVARATLEALIDYQHPKLSMDYPYLIKGDCASPSGAPVHLIKVQIRNINELLGDRA